jgi:UDP-N-acetylmuramyl pentapeptide synthase
VIGSLGKSTTVKAIKTALGTKVIDTNYSNGYGVICFSLLSTSPFAKYRVYEIAIGQPDQMITIGRILSPDIVVFTSVATDHISKFNGVGHICEEKSKILKYLKKGGKVFINGDDKNIRQKIGQLSKPYVSYGFNEENDIRCLRYSDDWTGQMSCEIEWGITQFNIYPRLFGKRMVYPILAAVGVGVEMKVNQSQLIENLNQLNPLYGRLQIQTLSSGVTVLCDFAKATAFSIKPAFDLIEASTFSKKILIVGSVNDTSISPDKADTIIIAIGEKVGKMADKAIFHGDLEPLYQKGALKAGMNPENIILANQSWKTAYEAIPTNLGKNDLIYITGRASLKMERIFLALKGDIINCKIESCMNFSYCKDCSFNTNFQ